MNEKFYRLPKEKQQRIINAGYRVFAGNSYKKSPMGEIASAAGISKSLLFYYFHNKKELYLFLWDEAAKITMEYMKESHCYEPGDLFEMLERGMRVKMHIIRRYPDMASFVIKAYYENTPEISAKIQESYRSFLNIKARAALDTLNPADFVPGLDLDMMYQEMLLASEGYVWKIIQQGMPLDTEKFERDFLKLIAFWKQVYLVRR